MCVDSVAPTTAGVLLNPPTVSPTNALPLTFSIAFSEPVTGLNGSSVVAGFTGTPATLVVGAVSGNGAGPYTFAVTGMSASGTATIAIRAANNFIRDLAINPLTAVGTAATLVWGTLLAARISVFLHSQGRGRQMSPGQPPAALWRGLALSPQHVHARCASASNSPSQCSASQPCPSRKAAPEPALSRSLRCLALARSASTMSAA
jgi:hypothetical protein